MPIALTPVAATGASALQHVEITIGELSSHTGVNVETVRYYERIGLVPQPPRSAGGRRVFAPSDVQRLSFIRRARELGFSIDDIRSLLEVAKGSGTCKDAYALAVRHRDAVRANIRDLRRLERKLSEAADLCSRGASSACAVIDALSQS
jgi:MerR family mercuric resistance operon transcriptional regulator